MFLVSILEIMFVGRCNEESTLPPERYDLSIHLTGDQLKALEMPFLEEASLFACSFWTMESLNNVIYYENLGCALMVLTSRGTGD